MDLEAVQTALKGWVEDVTGLEVIWRESESGYQGSWDVPAPAHMELRLVPLGPIGQRLETVHEYDDGAATGEEIIPHMMGLSRWRFEIRCVSHEQDTNDSALYYCERVALLLHSPSRVAATRSVHVGVESPKPTVDLTRTVDGRRLSEAQLDVILLVGINEEDVAYGYVEQFDLDSDWKDPAGNSLPDDDQVIGLYPPGED